jgi:hypothetical protein
MQRFRFRFLLDVTSAGKPFVAKTPWSDQRPRALVVYCSDGRWHAQVEEFICAQDCQRADLYAVPGGPAAFNLWGASFDENRVAEQTLRFLREHHQLETVWLIAHQDCAYYRMRYGTFDPASTTSRQFEDLERAREAIVRFGRPLQVHKVFALLDAGRVVFRELPAGSGAF